MKRRGILPKRSERLRKEPKNEENVAPQRYQNNRGYSEGASSSSTHNQEVQYSNGHYGSHGFLVEKYQSFSQNQVPNVGINMVVGKSPTSTSMNVVDKSHAPSSSSPFLQGRNQFRVLEHSPQGRPNPVRFAQSPSAWSNYPYKPHQAIYQSNSYAHKPQLPQISQTSLPRTSELQEQPNNLHTAPSPSVHPSSLVTGLEALKVPLDQSQPPSGGTSGNTIVVESTVETVQQHLPGSSTSNVLNNDVVSKKEYKVPPPTEGLGEVVFVEEGDFFIDGGEYLSSEGVTSYPVNNEEINFTQQHHDEIGPNANLEEMLDCCCKDDTIDLDEAGEAIIRYERRFGCSQHTLREFAKRKCHVLSWPIWKNLDYGSDQFLKGQALWLLVLSAKAEEAQQERAEKDSKSTGTGLKLNWFLPDMSRPIPQESEFGLQPPFKINLAEIQKFRSSSSYLFPSISLFIGCYLRNCTHPENAIKDYTYYVGSGTYNTDYLQLPDPVLKHLKSTVVTVFDLHCTELVTEYRNNKETLRRTAFYKDMVREMDIEDEESADYQFDELKRKINSYLQNGFYDDLTRIMKQTRRTKKKPTQSKVRTAPA